MIRGDRQTLPVSTPDQAGCAAVPERSGRDGWSWLAVLTGKPGRSDWHDDGAVAYVLEALLTRLSGRTLDSVAHPGKAVLLDQSADLVLIPITEDFRGKVSTGNDEPTMRFYRLTAGIVGWARTLSNSSGTAYVHAEFFGGAGFQAGVGWFGGDVVVGPFFAETHQGVAEPWYQVPPDGQPMAINSVLAWIGVQRDSARDEFEVVRLGRFRSTEEWLAATT